MGVAGGALTAATTFAALPGAGEALAVPFGSGSSGSTQALGTLVEACSPNLFGDAAVVVARNADSADDPLVAALLDAASAGEVRLVVLHPSGQKGRKVADSLAKGGFTVAPCEKAKGRAVDDFVSRELHAAKRKATPAAVEALRMAIGDDLRSLSAAIAQLVSDVQDDPLTPESVALYYDGVADVPGYLVSDAVYTEYGDNEWGRARDWAAGEPSPSVLTVCLIHRPAGAEPAAWYRHWHGVQSPVSAAIQPRSRYVRNEVIRPLTEGAPEIGGIVAESWPSIEHIVDPMLFFLADGDPDTMQRHVTEMIESVSAFIDLERMRNVTMSEYLW